MGLFDFLFKTEEQRKREKLLGYHEVIIELLSMTKRKKENTDIGALVSMNFDQDMIDRLHYKSLALDGKLFFLDGEFREAFQEMIENFEMNPDLVNRIWDYLNNEKRRLEEML